MSKDHKALHIQVEEELNAAVCMRDEPEDLPPRLHEYRNLLKKELEQIDSDRPSGFYTDVCTYMSRMCNPSFVKHPPKECHFPEHGSPDVNLNTSAFYLYAYIDKNTWSNMRRASNGIRKETGLKLVIALQLTEDEARCLLKKASLGLSRVDYRDQVVAALLRIRCYDPDLASEVLTEFGRDKRHPFQNIYDFA